MEEIIEHIINSLYIDQCSDKEVSKIYKIHKYWARKPWYIVEKYIEDYSSIGELVMDPFCGSGLAGYEAVINGRRFIGQDLNPTALRVSEGTLDSSFDFDSFQKDFDRIATTCADEIMSFYESDFICPKCGKFMFYKYCSIGPKFDGNQSGNLYCACGNRVAHHPMSNSDIIKAAEFSNKEIPVWYPTTEFPKKFYKDRFSYKGILTVADMFTKRNLYALALIYDRINHIDPKNIPFFKLAFTNTLLHVSKLKGENVRPLSVNNYWIPDDYIEENVWFRFVDRVNLLINSKRFAQKRENEKLKTGVSLGEWSIKKKSALESMGNECVDYFFTDPPYGDAIQYSELSFVWNAWMDDSYETKEEVIINPVQKKGTQEFNNLLCQSLDNIYAALKKDRYLTLCFQNKNSKIWKAIISHCKHLGFKLYDISIYNTYGHPFNKSWARFSPKSDIYVTLKKSDSSPLEYYSCQESVTEIVTEINRYIVEHEISVDNNKLYDLTISYLIWAMFLNEQEIDVSDFDIKKFIQLVQKMPIYHN